MFPVSAIHGEGIEALMDAAVASAATSVESTVQQLGAGTTIRLRDQPELADPCTSALKLAIVGRPNVGKSSIINALTQSERVIVSPIPGTTRDAVDVPFEVETEGQRQATSRLTPPACGRRGG